MAMNKQMIRLCRLQLTNLFGINEFRFTKDKSKKRRYVGMATAWGLLILMLIGYVVGFSYIMAAMGMTEIIPMYLYAMAGLLILIFSFFKAGNTIFAIKGYEVLLSLPVSRTAIIISRFMSMYVTSLLLGLLIMVPGVFVYACFAKPAAGFYLVCVLGTIFLPLLPLTISSVLGALITAVSSRTKHKTLIETLLMIIVLVGALGASLFLPEKESQVTKEMFRNLAEGLSDQIAGTYPPAAWFHKALDGDMESLALMIVVPVIIFIVFVAVLQKYYQNICMAVHAVTAKNNYRITGMQRRSHMSALWHRDLKRYFSSSVYVVNTIAGCVIAAVLAAGIFIVGLDRMERELGIPGISVMIAKGLPFALSAVLVMNPVTAVSISMEGNTFWQIQTLPVSAAEFYKSKILLNLTIAAPFYLMTVILTALAVKPAILELVWLIVIPACYIVFTGIAGITVNLTFPVLKWDSEVTIVKQSASMSVAMLLGIITALLPLVLMFFLKTVNPDLICLLTVVMLLVASVFLYRKNGKVELLKIG